uniref:zinc-ribbon domain-containing protein n=1 Tax=Amycolatopsis sp. CA-096443 TaxID=3239919 RepID=UPI003F491FFB
MRMRPEQALAVVHPEVAATWDPDRNGVHTPENTSAKNSLRAYWRCPAGHVWCETVAARTGMPAWKQGDRAACRVCVGHSVPTKFTCGHTVLMEARFSRPDRTCPACQRATWAEIEKQRDAQRERARVTHAGTGDEARELLADIEIPESAPAPLVIDWRREALTLIRRAMVAEREFGKTGATGTAKRQATQALTALPPAEEQLRAAVDAGNPVVVLGKAHWPYGWLHLLGHETAVPAEEPETVDFLHAWLQHGLVRGGRDRLASSDTKSGTRILTGLVLDWADAQPYKFRHHRWVGYRELTIPITPGGSTRYGRLDIVITRPGKPDLVIEIDSTHNPRSVEKLQFAHAAGAVPIWIRWQAGSLHETGVPTIDLRPTANTQRQ